MPTIFHLITETDWQTAGPAGEWRPPSLADEGFVHCSKDQDQLFRVAQRLYAGRDDLLALELDTAKLTHSVITEPSRSGELYPHIYGPLELAAVQQVWRLTPDANGNFTLVERT